MTPEERAERRLLRKTEAENARRIAEAPLLAHAGLVPLTDAEEQRERKARHRAEAVRQHGERLAAHVENLRRASAIRGRLQREVGYQEIAACDAYLVRVLPQGYVLIFWREREERHRRGEPLLSEVDTWTPEQNAASRQRIRDLLAVWRGVDVAHPDLVAAAMAPPSPAQRRAVRTLGELRGEAADRLLPRTECA